MKKSWFWFLAFVPLMVLLVGCNQGGSVKDPPRFVEMYLDPESAIPEEVRWPSVGNGLILLEETTSSETTSTVSPEIYDGEVFSESAFEVIVITSGENYDLLFSVELQDSLLGSCVYTNQSTLYYATSTIVVENDGTYTTTVRLTIPPTTDPQEYFSDRTISLTKILFTRDTVNGTFPADIPSNTTTSQLFRIHAREYFDPLIGLPLRINDEGFVDVMLTPESRFYQRAQTAAVGVIDLPATVNGYPIGGIFLQDLDWATELHLAGATDNVFIVGDFSNLSVLILSDFSFTVMTESRNISLYGSFPALSLIELHNIDRFRFLLAEDTITTDEDYLNFCEEHPTMVNEFPVLASVLVTGSRLGHFQIGKDAEDVEFPALVSVSASQSVISDFYLGNEDNLFPVFETLTLSDCRISSIRIGGTKPAESPGAQCIISLTKVDFNVVFEGSLVGSLALNDSDLGGLEIRGGTIQASKWTGISVSGEGLTETGFFRILGSHPLWEEMNFHDLEAVTINVGGIESQFAALTSIVMTNIQCQALYIGDRDAAFPILTEVILTGVEATNRVFITGENTDYPLLASILIDQMVAGDLIIAHNGDDFSALETITIRNSVFTDELIPAGGGVLTSLESIIIEGVECVTFQILNSDDSFELFIDDLVATVNFYLNPTSCSKIWVKMADVTAWDRYGYAVGEGIPVETWVQ
ncbi:MAG TPA: hypothetical protein P5154_05450 [Candidatus Izemoplasmatales bacterium]|nr:hypothetical protein [Candidatus Izemoplasmatales bacterium]